MKMSAIFRFHKPGQQCRWCGHNFEHAFEVGCYESFSFLEFHSPSIHITQQKPTAAQPHAPQDER